MSRSLALLLLAGTLAACTSNGSGDATPTTSRPSTSRPARRQPGVTSTSPGIANARVGLTVFATHLDNPVAFSTRHDDAAVYVAEQYRARVLRVSTPGSSFTTVLDLHGRVSKGTEQGLLGLAFSPDGARLYIDYTDTNGDTNIDEYTMRGNLADAASRRAVLFQKQPFPNHNGGQLAFGPDGMLYIALGDGGSAGDPNRNAQNPNTLLGKILRIDPRANGSRSYSVPTNNPFVGDAAARPEIWMLGLRNPWRFSFDRADGDLWIGDVGQDNYEEVDWAAAGRAGLNFGWNRREGTHGYHGGTRPTGAIDPVVDYEHIDNNCSVTGGFVYRGPAIAALRGAYIYADFCAGNLIALSARNGTLITQRTLGVHVDQPTSFGQDNNGELYVLSRAGTIYTITQGAG